MGDHPFVLEYRVRSSSDFSVALMRRSRRYWELHLLLSLVLRGRITRETFEPQHHWVILLEPMPNSLQTAYVNEGYLVGEGFLLVADDFSDPSEYPQLAVVPDDDYYARRGVSRDEMDVPACLDVFFDRFDAADTRTRDRLLRASYWLDAAYRVWHVSKSLSGPARKFVRGRRRTSGLRSCQVPVRTANWRNPELVGTRSSASLVPPRLGADLGRSDTRRAGCAAHRITAA